MAVAQAGFKEARSRKESWDRFPRRSAAAKFRPGLHGSPSRAPFPVPRSVASAPPLSVPPQRAEPPFAAAWGFTFSCLFRLPHCLHWPLSPYTGPCTGWSDHLSRTLGLYRRSPCLSPSLFQRFSVLPILESQAPYSSLALALSPPRSPDHLPTSPRHPSLFWQHYAFRFPWGFSNSNISG